MKKGIRYALLAGAILVAGAGIALAQMAPPPPPDMYGPGPMHGRLADRALRDFDLNHDGQITKAELDKVLAQRFSEATGGAATMIEAQFAKSHEKMLRQHTNEMFRRIDWNGDGVLSLDEFRAPLRARFAMMDRDATGTISCRPGASRGKGFQGKGRAMQGPRKGHRMGGRSGGGFAQMCREADLNRDGKVTRAEFDKAAVDKFAAATKGGKGLTPDAFYALEQSRFREMEARRFERLDTNNDGKLSEAEFAAPGQKLFARLDKKRDGVVTKDELAPQPHRGYRGGLGKKPG